MRLLIALLLGGMAMAQDCRPNVSIEVKGTDYYALPAWDTALTFIQPADAMQDLFPGFAFFVTQPQWEPVAYQNTWYCSWIEADGGELPYVYSETGLPAGLALDGNTGGISGTPVVRGTYQHITYTVTDSTGQSVSITRLMRVCGIGEYCNGFN